MITFDTKIKDLLPSGYELDGVKTCDTEIVITMKKEKPAEKDFDWYVKEYMRKSNFPLLQSDTQAYLARKYKAMCFETKIGIFKFVCNDLNLLWHVELYYIIDSINSGGVYGLSNVCDFVPVGFIQSLVQ